MTESRRLPTRLFCLLAAGLLVAAAVAQSVPVQRAFPRSKSNVEQALRGLQAYAGGRLPVLDGFVAGDQALDRYQRPYYQYSLQVVSSGPGSCVVHVGARITAWYAASLAAQSGYRVLPSNGRLETDLLDRLGDVLGDESSGAAGPAAPSGPGMESAAAPAAKSSPAPAPRKAPARALALPPAGEATLPARSPTPTAQAAADDLHIQQLSKEAKNLEQILQHQAQPNDLAAVKESRTPVRERPQDDAKLLFLAEAEDEFQIVETNGPWVHVQISGLSRGWIRRSALQLPSAYDSAAPVSAAEVGPASPFRQTRQETAAFPGSWEALRGKQVKVIWVQPAGNTAADADKFNYAKSVFRKAFPELLHSSPPLAGVVIVFDSEDGGMAAATLATLQQWNAHHMTDNIFWKQCWFDPADAFKLKD